MNIVLTGMDASANNLGQVAIYDRPIEAYTIAFLANFEKTFTTDQKYKIQNFIDALNAATYKTKIKHLYIPKLSLTVNSAFLNIKDLVSGTVTDKGTALLKSAYTIDSDGGLISPYTDYSEVAGYSNASGISIGTVSGKNHHVIVFGVSDAKTITYVSNSMLAYAVNSYGIWSFQDLGTPRVNTPVNGAAYNYNYIKNVIIGHSWTLADKRISHISGSTYDERISDTPFTDTTGNGYLFSNGYDKFFKAFSLGLVSIGDPLTQAEMIDYSSILKSLMDAL